MDLDFTINRFLIEVVILGQERGESIPFPRTETDDTAGERGVERGVDPAEISFDNQH